MKSDDEMHEHHRAAAAALSVALDAATAPSVDVTGMHAVAMGNENSSSGSLFDEFYDDWAAFDAAVAHAMELHHPIRKRSSLTFEVYNRTVSKGRHDRKSIAEYLSKTFKCTHGIKFRPRGKGRRERHKPRDTGCPFHVYATAVEFGATYRVRVRQQDRHNHPIGPDALKAMSGLLDTDYDLVGTSDSDYVGHQQQQTDGSSPPAATTTAGGDIDLDTATKQTLLDQHDHHHLHDHQSQSLADPHNPHQHQQPLADHAHAHVLYKAQQQAIAHAHAQELMQQQQQAEAHEQLLHAQAQAQAQVQATELLVVDDDDDDDATVHDDSTSLLERAIERSINGDFADAAKEPAASVSEPAPTPLIVEQPQTPTPASPPVATAVPIDSEVTDAMASEPVDVPAAAAAAAQLPASTFEPTTTLETIRRKMATFADERDWNQFHTPRNLVLALTGEVGELCELFQWRGDNTVVADWTPDEKVHLGEEMSDVLLYLVRLADQCNVDLAAAVHDKMAKNARKYPAELVRGSSKKYNEYKRQRVDSSTSDAATDVQASSATPPSIATSSSDNETARI